MPSFCCAECFGDRGLRKNIIPSLSVTKGRCNFCGTEDKDLVAPNQLADVFEMLLSIYELDPNGKSIVTLLKEDWQLFSHGNMRDANAQVLLGEVLDDGDFVRRTYSPSSTYHSEGLARWETLRDELLYKNRYFLDEALDTDRLHELLPYLLAEDLPDTWYRARILSEDASYPLDKMGAPPHRSATHGRANPVGIPYLYLGSLPETAVSEIRPHTGERACVATFSVPRSPKAIDLRNPRQLVSPFLLGNADEIGQMRADIPFLERLGEELTRPVLPRSAAIDYIPSQYLCEFIKKDGYDGVIYRSSVSSGMNLALFKPDMAVGAEVKLYNIDRVAVDVTEAVA